MNAVTEERPNRVGVIGLGAMGWPMARLLAAGHGDAYVTSSRPARQVLSDLDSEGSQVSGSIHWCETPADLAASCDKILLMLPDLPQIIECLDAVDGLLAGLERRTAAAPALLLAIGSTCSATGVRNLAGRLHRTHGERIVLVDAPVSGGADGAKAGTLSIMLGGVEEHCHRAAQMLAPCGTAVRLGELGAGQAAKACNQLVVSATIFALGEASVLAERSGLDLAAMWELLGGGYASSRLLDSRRDRLVSGDDSPSGVIKYLRKDLDCARELAEATSTHAVLLPALRQAVDEVIDAGLGDRDLAVTKRFIAER